jgi:toxin-antitoxin system PIN domain toxin
VIALDTNILVHAHRASSPCHAAAMKAVATLAHSDEPWAIPYHRVVEFLAVVTNPRAFERPSKLDEALAQVDEWLRSGTLVLLTESEESWPYLREAARSGQRRGGQLHDARIAAVCLEHKVSELWSADRDFSHFPQLRVRNPLTA